MDFSHIFCPMKKPHIAITQPFRQAPPDTPPSHRPAPVRAPRCAPHGLRRAGCEAWEPPVPRENHGKTHGKAMGKPWKTHGKAMGKPET